MASTIASLFGPSAEEIMYQQQQDERDRQAVEFYRGLGAIDVPGVATGMVAGRGIGQGLRQAVQGAFGTGPMQDPALAKATSIRNILGKTDLTNLNDPNMLDSLAQQMQQEGHFNEAVNLANRANTLRTQAAELELKRRKIAASSGIDFNAINAFQTQVRNTMEPIENGLAHVSNARQFLALLRIDDENSTAEAGLANFLAKATGDARLSEAEVNRVAAGGSIGRRVADKLNKWITGTSTPETNEDREEVINAMEIVLNERYNKKRKSLMTSFGAANMPSYIMDDALPELSLSTQASGSTLKKTGDGNQSGDGWGNFRRSTTNTTTTTTTGSNRSRLMSGGN
jgi:hypothetical protein